MCPPPDITMCGRNVRIPYTTPQKLTPIVHSQPSIGPSHGSPPPATPALLQTMCTAPNRSIVACANASTCSTLLTSVLTASVSTPSSSIVAVARSSASSCTSASTTEHPAVASALASAKPIPLPAPVTTAILPFPSSMEPLSSVKPRT